MELIALLLDSGFLFSPFIVPVAGCFMILGIVASGVWSSVRNREIQSQERLAAIARGVPLPPTVEELAIIHGKPSADMSKRMAKTRLTGIILVGSAVGLILFFLLLTAIIRQHEILSGAAVGLFPLGLGIAFLVDARIQARELQSRN